MSTDFDLTPAPAETAPAAGPALSAPTPPATRTVAVPPSAEEGASSLGAFLVTGGPAIAIIMGCYLMWAYGPWLLLGALLLAAIAAAAAIKAFAARSRRTRSSARAGRTSPSRAGPGSIRSLLGSNSSAGGRKTAPGSRGPAGTRTPKSGAASVKAAAARTERRGALLTRGGKTGAGAAGKKTAAVRQSAPTGSNLARAAKALTGNGGKTSGATKPSSTTKPSARTSGAAGARRGSGAHGRPGLLRRTLGKTMPGGKTRANRAAASAGKAGTAGTSATKKAGGRTAPAKTSPRTTTPSKTPKSKASKAAAARRTATAGKTSTGRRKVRITPAVAAAATRRRTVTAKLDAFKARKTGKTTTPGTRGTTPGRPRSKSASRIARTVRRTATHRKVRATRAKAVRGARRGLRATNTILSPLAARAFMRTGRALGWAQRHMLRIANSTESPAWAPRFAGGIATGIGGVMAAGLWVSRRRHAQKWLLKHYASTSLGNAAAVAVKATRTVLGPAKTPAGHTAKPGPAIRIATPRSPILTLPGASTMSTPDDIADAFDQFLSTFEPESVSAFSSHFNSLAPMLERFADATTKHAERLRDEYGVKGGVVDMLDQFGSAFGGMHDLAEEVVQSWQHEHAEDIERTENPRPNEETTWNYKPGE